MDKVKIEPFKVIGISVRTTNENNQATKDIADLWDKFMNEKVFGAKAQNPADAEIDFLIAIK